MKIGILTQPLTHNYGGLLQNWALQQVLIRDDYEVETLDHINYGRFNWAFFHKMLAWIRYFFGKQGKPKYQLSKSEKSKINAKINEFIETYIKRTKILKSERDFIAQIKKVKYDAFVVGSDQCWRPCYNSRALQDMFLSFIPINFCVKRIAYAVSFGSDKWEYSTRQTSFFARLAQRFDFITVREDSGVSLCKQYFGVNAAHVLDPTMLLTKEDYIKLINAENESASEGTLFNYILDPCKKKLDFINRVANCMNLKAFQVLPKYQAETRTEEEVKNHIEDCVFPAVTVWLRAFWDAHMTIVDSFHGMVFSILFNKPFWVIGNRKRGMSRFSSLLKLFNLENRLIDIEDLDKIDCTIPIDWNHVNALLEIERIKSKKILLSSLQRHA